MFIYADESGNTGRDVFSAPPLFWEGAIFSIEDIESIVEPVITEHRQRLGMTRLHAHKMKIDDVITISKELMEALSQTEWEFQVSLLEKDYLVPTKFVDTFFDHAENEMVPAPWYNETGKRHTLCFAFDSILTEKNKKQFWKAFLSDNKDELVSSLNNAKTYLPRYVNENYPLYDVILEGLRWAASNIDTFEIATTETRHSYKEQCPNFIAFTALYDNLHNFASKHNVGIVRFTHDKSSEFKKTLKDCHQFLGKGQFVEKWFGYPPLWEPVSYEEGSLVFESSRDSYALQAVDLFTWVMQRQDPVLASLKQSLSKQGDTFRITRRLTAVLCKLHVGSEFPHQFKKQIFTTK